MMNSVTNYRYQPYAELLGIDPQYVRVKSTHRNVYQYWLTLDLISAYAELEGPVVNIPGFGPKRTFQYAVDGRNLYFFTFSPPWQPPLRYYRTPFCFDGWDSLDDILPIVTLKPDISRFRCCPGFDGITIISYKQGSPCDAGKAHIYMLEPRKSNWRGLSSVSGASRMVHGVKKQLGIAETHILSHITHCGIDRARWYLSFTAPEESLTAKATIIGNSDSGGPSPKEAHNALLVQVRAQGGGAWEVEGARDTGMLAHAVHTWPPHHAMVVASDWHKFRMSSLEVVETTQGSGLLDGKCEPILCMSCQDSSVGDYPALEHLGFQGRNVTLLDRSMQIAFSVDIEGMLWKLIGSLESSA